MQFADGTRARLYIIAKGIFRLIVDPAAEFKPLTPSLTIAASNFSLRPFEDSQLLVTDETFTIKSGRFHFHTKVQLSSSIFDDQLHRYRMMQSSPIVNWGAIIPRILTIRTRTVPTTVAGCKMGASATKEKLSRLKMLI